MESNTHSVISFSPMGLNDMDRIAHWFSDFDDVALFDGTMPVPVSPEYVRESWKTALEYRDPPRALWFMAETEDGTPAGICGLQAINYIHGDAVVPLFVAKHMRRKGVAKALGILVIDMAFERLRLHRLTTIYRDDNLPSAAIIKSLGFIEEGRKREAWYAGGQHRDAVHVGLLKSEWVKRRGTLRGALEDTGRFDMNINPSTP